MTHREICIQIKKEMDWQFCIDTNATNRELLVIWKQLYQYVKAWARI